MKPADAHTEADRLTLESDNFGHVILVKPGMEG